MHLKYLDGDKYLHLFINHSIYGQGRLSPPVTQLCQRQRTDGLFQRQLQKALDLGNLGRYRTSDELRGHVREIKMPIHWQIDQGKGELVDVLVSAIM